MDALASSGVFNAHDENQQQSYDFHLNSLSSTTLNFGVVPLVEISHVTR